MLNMSKVKVSMLAASSALVLAIGLVGCGGGQQAASTGADAEASASAAVAADTAADAAATSAPAATATTAPASTTETTTTTAQDSYIGDAAAVDVALSDAGLDESAVAELSCELDLDDAVVHYDVDFKKDGVEYDYDIDAVSGAIITSSQEFDD